MALFLVITCFANAQINNINTKAKYILNANNLITEENGKFYVDFIRVQFDREEAITKITITRSERNFNSIEELLTGHNATKENLTQLSDLTEKNFDAIISDLKQKQFSFPEYNFKFNVTDKENAINRKYGQGSRGDIVLFESSVLNLYPITINNKYTIFCIRDISLKFSFGYILPLQNKYILKLHGHFFIPDTISKTDRSDVLKQIGTLYKKGNVYKKNNKYGLKSESGNQIFLQPLYDTIYYYENFIISKKAKLFQAHYKNGELLNIPNLKGIVLTRDGYGALIKDTTYWMDESGELFDSIPFRESAEFCGTVPQVVISIVKEKDHFKFTNSNSDYNDLPIGNGKVLCSVNSLKGITFLNQQTKIVEVEIGYSFISQLIETNTYIVETLDNSKSVAKITDGKIEYLLKPDKYTFTYINKEVLIFKLKGLYGLYPFQKKPKYTKMLDFEKGFARIELPNGKKGWLDLDGHEYLDK